MTYEELKRLNSIVSARRRMEIGRAADVEFLLEMLVMVARTAGSHYDSANNATEQSGELDAIAIIDTITGERHLRIGPRPTDA